MQRNPPFCTILLLVFTLGFAACNNTGKPVEKDIAISPEELKEKTITNIKNELAFAAKNAGQISDSVILSNQPLVEALYKRQDYQPMWSENDGWKATADSLAGFVEQAKFYGLFPADYHSATIGSIRERFMRDTTGKGDDRDAALWSRLDLALTDAFLHLMKDVKLGRLPNDSVSMRKDSTISDELFTARLDEFRQHNHINRIMASLEPTHSGYRELKASLPAFLANASSSVHTKVPAPKTNPLLFRAALQARLEEGGYLLKDSIAADSAKLADGVKSFQKDAGITVDGKAGTGTIRMLNLSDEDRFITIAITMDRYKLLPETMPERYIWVNLPGYYMQLRQRDTIVLSSKIVCGKPMTRTPLLTSTISDLVTYPQWTIPTSIIARDIIPAAKKDPGYFARKGYSLVDNNGDEVDPYEVDWTKYTKGLPYKVVQGSGDDNALGILKFNFPNHYSVYLHDTNQRYLFAQTMRSLSHGCVRVQQWKDLAFKILRYDNGGDLLDDDVPPELASPVEDSMSAWLQRKEKHSIRIHKKVPVFIRYFTCEGKDGKITFYDDIYGEDRLLQARYFTRK